MFQNIVKDKISAIYICELVDGKSEKKGRDRKYLATHKLNPDFQKLLDAKIPYNITAKIDGTCSMIDNHVLLKRRDIKPGKKIPNGWKETGIGGKRHRIGFMEVNLNEKDNKWFKDAFASPEEINMLVWEKNKLIIKPISLNKLKNQSVELVGPKIQGNPHGLLKHCFIKHGLIGLNNFPKDMEFSKVKSLFENDENMAFFEGIVVHFKTGEMFKIHKHHMDLPWISKNITDFSK